MKTDTRCIPVMSVRVLSSLKLIDPTLQKILMFKQLKVGCLILITEFPLFLVMLNQQLNSKPFR